MNYRHAYHAGNFADVFKHIVLVGLTQSLLRKDSAFCFLDTHAGSGFYDLSSDAAQKGKEFENGIKKLFAQENPPELVKQYLECITDPLQYPGSPLIVQHFLRPQDRMILSELHPEEYQQLKRLFARNKQVAVHNQNGYDCIKAFLPPKEKRGFVLIDPPYEKPDELMQLTRILPEALRRWESGIFALWYPIKNREAIERFHQTLQEKIEEPILTVELSIYPENITTHLNGSGMVIINPPWQLDQTLEDTLPWVWKALSINKQGRYHLNLR